MKTQKDIINNIVNNSNKVVKSKRKIPMNKIFDTKQKTKIIFPNDKYEDIDLMLKKEKLEKVIRKYKR